MKKSYLLFAFIIAFYYQKAQIISTFAGTGTISGFSGDGGQATSALLYNPFAITKDASGNFYIADASNKRIRKVTPGGIITTVAGNGAINYNGDGGQATSASIVPTDVRVDGAGNIYICDFNNNRIRMVNTAGIISTIAGNGTTVYPGDGNQATSVGIKSPQGLCMDATGNIYYTDSHNNCIRKISTSGIVTTIAGTGVGGFSGDGGPALSAQLSVPSYLSVDAKGNIFFIDGQIMVRKIDTAGKISTVAGTGSLGFSGDGGPAINAKFSTVSGLALDAAGNLYISDENNFRIRMVDTNGIIKTIAGNGLGGYLGDGGLPTSARLNYPTGIYVDPSGDYYFGEQHNIRKVGACASPVSLSITGNTNVCAGTATTFSVSGATSYTWSANAGGATTNTVSVSANVNTTYSVTGLSGNCVAYDTITLFVNPAISVNGTNTVCLGNSILLTASGATNYTWSANAGSVTTNTVSVTPSGTTATVYTVTGNAGACTNQATFTVTAKPLPVVNGYVSRNGCSGSIISAENFGSTPAGASFSWTNDNPAIGIAASGSGSISSYTAPVVSGVQTGIFTVTPTLSGCSGNSATFSITISPQPTVTVTGNLTVCGGSGSTTLTAHGATSYTWSSNAGSSTADSVTLSPATTTTYYVYGNSLGCNSVNAYATVTVTPVITITGPSTSCSGKNVLLTASGANSYTWSANAGSVTTDTVRVSPSTTTIYTVTGALGGCTSSQVYSVSVINSPTISISGPSGIICSNAGAGLTGSGASTYTWSANAGGAVSAHVAVYPTSATTYTLYGTGTNGCVASNTVQVNGAPSPTITITGPDTICYGSSAVLHVTGANSYTWTVNSMNSYADSIIIAPEFQTNYYYVHGNIGSCSSSKNKTVAVKNIVTVAAPTAICSGDTAWLSASGSTSYTWMPSGINGAVLIAAPVTPTTYTVVSQKGSCIHTDTIPVNVTNCNSSVSCQNTNFETGDFTDWNITTAYNYPDSIQQGILGILGCYTGPAVLNSALSSCDFVSLCTSASGNDYYGGFPVVPSGAGNYIARMGGTVINIASSCSNNPSNYNGAEFMEQTFYVTPQNSTFTYHFAVVLQDGHHFPGDQAYFKTEVFDAGNVLIPSLTYSVGAIDNSIPPGFYASTTDVSYMPWRVNTINLNPYIGQHVKIRFTTSGCDYGEHFSYSYIDIPCGPAQIQGANICYGTPAVLQAPPNYSAYHWYGPGILSPATNQTVSVNAPGTYSVVLTTQNAVTSTITTNVTAGSPTTTISGANSMCAGSSLILVAGGASTYTWSSNAGNAVNDSVIVSPLSNDTYWVTGTDVNGCTSTTSHQVTVNQLPSISVTASPDTICLGFSAILMAGNAATYTWSANAGSVNSSTVSVSPTSMATYTVSGTDNNGCTNTSAETVYVNACSTGLAGQGPGKFVIYPNPATDKLLISSKENIGVVKIYNSFGELVLSTQCEHEKESIDISRLANGVYIISVSGYSTKFLKN